MQSASQGRQRPALFLPLFIAGMPWLRPARPIFSGFNANVVV
jgi:hypothetical protein